jgi:tRNA acetyltransferase TAN1
MPISVPANAYGPQNILGMSVVGPDFEELKRYNLAELLDAGEDGDKALVGTNNRDG